MDKNNKNNNELTMRLELVPIPVTDINRAKGFYAESVGFHVDHDVNPAAGVRIVQLTPPGSACSIVLGQGVDQRSRALRRAATTPSSGSVPVLQNSPWTAMTSGLWSAGLL